MFFLHIFLSVNSNFCNFLNYLQAGEDVASRAMGNGSHRTSSRLEVEELAVKIGREAFVTGGAHCNA